MNIKELKITNSRGDSITFGRHFRLIEDFNISGLEADVFLSNTTLDGAHYQNTKLKTREFDIPFYIKRDNQPQWWIEERRHELYKVLNPKQNPMRIDFTMKSEKSYYINAQSTSAPQFLTGAENDNKRWLRVVTQFVANDPFIYENTETNTELASWIKNWTFPLQFDAPIPFAYRLQSLIANVENTGSEPTGMLITFTASQTVMNPKILNINTYEELMLNTTMQAGDVIEVSTYRGNRYVRLKRNGIVTNIFGTLDLASTFLQLDVGDNLFRYDASSGIDFLEVTIKHTNTLIGV